MMKRFKKWLKSLFSAKFIVPQVNQKLATAIDDKNRARGKEFEKLKEEHNLILRGYVRTYLDKTYTCEADQSFAFDYLNRKWKEHARKINSSSKIITLNKKGFEIEVNGFIKSVLAKAA